MTQCRLWTASFVLILSFCDAALGQRPASVPSENLPAGTRAFRNLPYGGHGNGNLLDLYLPKKTETSVPLIIWVHGGAWEKGSKENPNGIPLLAKGYAVASINYRLTPQAHFPAQIHDCKAAVRWLRGNAKKYNLDPDHFGAWGASAGGHLVALLGTSGGVEELEGKVGNYAQSSSRVQAVCDWFGPTDLEQFAGYRPPGQPDAPKQWVMKLLGGSVEKSKAKAKKANPITYVTDKSPPFLIMHGDRDTLVPLQHSQQLEQALKQAGADVTFHVVPGAGHGIGDPASPKLVEEFFDKHLKR